MKAATKPSIESLQDQLMERNEKILQHEGTIRSLEEQLAWLKRQIFGKKSERIIDVNADQLLFDGFEVADTEKTQTQTVASHKRKKRTSTGKDTIQLPDDLPVETTVIDIPEEEKVCKETGVRLQKIGEEISYKLAHKPGNCFLKRFIRPKYAYPKQEENGVVTASMPDSLLPKCRADESLLAEIVTCKFADHLPLYRIAEGLARENIIISRRLLSNWAVDVGAALQPLYQAMKKKILEGNRIHIDESPVDILDSPKVKKGYMWIVVGGMGKDPPYRLYDFKESRQHGHVEKILGSYSGIIHSDKYGAYEKYIRKHGNVWCPCWVHIRRKFYEGEMGDPVLRTWVLQQIQELFDIEKTAWGQTPSERVELRKKEAVPIIDALIERVKDRLMKGKILPKSKFREALGYFCSLIPYLKNYIEHADARLDNNPAERAVRPLAIGRKNWLFFGSTKSGEAAATLISLIQTCRALKINPRVYLEDVCRRIMGHNAQKLHELLPDEWRKRQPIHKAPLAS